MDFVGLVRAGVDHDRPQYHSKGALFLSLKTGGFFGDSLLNINPQGPINIDCESIGVVLTLSAGGQGRVQLFKDYEGTNSSDVPFAACTTQVTGPLVVGIQMKKGGGGGGGKSASASAPQLQDENDTLRRVLKRTATERDVESEEKQVALREKRVAEEGWRQAAKQADDASTNFEQRVHCVVCREKDRSVLTSPCKHLCMCADCAPHVPACPVCMSHITDRTSVYLS